MTCRLAGSNLAERIRDLDRQAKAALAEAAAKDELVKYASEAVAERKKEAMSAVEASYLSTAVGASVESGRGVEAITAEAVRLIGPLLDELARAGVTQHTISGIVANDKAVGARQLMQQLAHEADLEAASPRHESILSAADSASTVMA